MSERVNPFENIAHGNITQLPAFDVRPRRPKPVEAETIEKIAAENNFPSRQAPRTSPVPKRKAHRYRTGRNEQMNIRTTGRTKDRFYRMAEELRVPHGELLDRALDAFESSGPTPPETTSKGQWA